MIAIWPIDAKGSRRVESLDHEDEQSAAAILAVTSAPRFWLHVDGDLRGQIALDRERFVVGRGPDCDLVLDDETVSRDHLVLSRHGGAVVAADLESRNGTVLNGRPLDRPTRLRHGDTLVLGSARLQIILPGHATGSATQAAGTSTAKLSDEEREVASALVAQFRQPGLLAPRPATRAEIADAVHLSERTVQRRIDGLATKLKLPSHPHASGRTC